MIVLSLYNICDVLIRIKLILKSNFFKKILLMFFKIVIRLGDFAFF